MKFLCISCDEAMSLNRTAGPDEGSMTVVFKCPACEREVAMLTNAMETQMVRALDVKIGGRSVPAEPMSVVKGALAGSRLAGDGGTAATPPGEPRPTGASPRTDPAASGQSDPASGQSKCPFSGAVSAAFDDTAQFGAGAHGGSSDGRSADDGAIRWTDEATERIERVPSYIRSMIRRGVEDYAREMGCAEVDTALMDEVRGRFGM